MKDEAVVEGREVLWGVVVVGFWRAVGERGAAGGCDTVLSTLELVELDQRST